MCVNLIPYIHRVFLGLHYNKHGKELIMINYSWLVTNNPITINLKNHHVWWVSSGKLLQLLKMAIEIVDLPIQNGVFPEFFLMFTRVWHHVKALKPYEIPMRNLQDLSPRWIQLLLCGYLQVFARLLQCGEAQCQRLWYPREGLCGGALSKLWAKQIFGPWLPC